MQASTSLRPVEAALQPKKGSMWLTCVPFPFYFFFGLSFSCAAVLAERARVGFTMKALSPYS